MARPRKNKKQNVNRNNSEKSKEIRTNQTSSNSQKRFLLKPKTKNQEEFIITLAENTVTMAIGPAGTGKALTLNSKLFTKSGPIRMGDVKVGDEIANPDGGFSKVTGVYPQGSKIVHRVFFSNGCYVDCCEDHLWKVKRNDNGWSGVVDTKFLIKNCRGYDGKRLLSIPCTKPVSFERKQYVIDPYFMGIIISEGGLTSRSLCFTSCEESRAIKEYAYRSSSSSYNKKNIYIEELRSLNLWDKCAYQKHIPEKYKYGSIDQRIALLQGLIDGDGIISKKGNISYCTTSFYLIKDFCELVYSLGGTTKITEKTRSLRQDETRCRKSYQCYLNLPNDIKIFFISRKKKRVVSRKKYSPKLYVDRVEKLGEQEMQCISVDHKDHLYLTDNYIPTHNTKIAVAYGIEKLLNGCYKRLIITRPIVEAGEQLGYLPGPQPLDAKLLTPNGWATMGEINVGDFVIGRDGLPTRVLGIFPKGYKDVYKIKTSDGTSTECCLDHLWHTRTAEEKKRGKSGGVRSTKEIFETLKNKKGKINHFLPRNESVNYNKQNLPIPPYTLGVLLGDGHIGNHITFASADKEISDRVRFESESIGINCVELKNKNSCKSYNLYYNSDCRKNHRKICLTNVDNQEQTIYDRIHEVSNLLNISKNAVKDRCARKTTINKIRFEFLPLENKWSSRIKNIMEDLNLQGKRSFDKHIPDIYKYSSVEDRISLLRGLMDTDGTVKKNGEASFTTTSKKLANDMIEIVRSLGGRATFRERNRIGKNSQLKDGRCIVARRVSYEFNISMPKNINPFYLKRKAKRFNCKYIHSIGITSIEPVGKKQVQCIMVENPEHLYITDDFIVTHNTFSEKLDPYLQPIYYELSHYISKQELETFINNGINRRGEKEIIIAPLAYMRGMNYHDSYMILDECQNCTKEQIKLFVTRVGFNSKAVLVGDDKQSDLPNGKSGLSYWFEKLQAIKDVGTFKLDKSDIIRNPVISNILEKIGE